MKKSYIIALIFIGILVIGMIAYYFISTYGPGSERAQMKKRVEYVLESYGAINHDDGTWSTYSNNPADLQANVSAKSMAVMFKKGSYEDEKEARESLLVGVIFDIDKVEKKDGKYVVTVELTLPDKRVDTCYFLFEKKLGDWEMDPRCIELAVYVGNGYGQKEVNSLMDILDLVTSM